MKGTSAKFTIPTEYLSAFSKKLYPLAKTGDSGTLTILAHKDSVQVVFKADVDPSGISGFFEYVFTEAVVHTSGIINVPASDFADVINKFPYLKNNRDKKPHTEELTFTATKKSLKIKTTIFWNSTATPTEQQLQIPLLKDKDEDENPLLIEEYGDGLVRFMNDDFISAIDMCSFIRGDVTSKDEYGYRIFTEGNDVIMMATDLQVAARYVIRPVKSEGHLEGVAGRQALNAIRNYMQGAGEVQVTTFPKKIYVKGENRRMIVPLLKKEFPIDSEIFFEDSRELASVEIASLGYVLNHFLSVDKDPFHKTTFEFYKKESKFRLFSGDGGVNNVDNLPAEIKDDGFFDVDATCFSSILPRLGKLSDSCKIYVNDLGRELIMLMSEESEARYLIQAINRKNYEEQSVPEEN